MPCETCRGRRLRYSTALGPIDIEDSREIIVQISSRVIECGLQLIARIVRQLRGHRPSRSVGCH
jgi:hypothetical protein